MIVVDRQLLVLVLCLAVVAAPVSAATPRRLFEQTTESGKHPHPSVKASTMTTTSSTLHPHPHTIVLLDNDTNIISVDCSSSLTDIQLRTPNHAAAQAVLRDYANPANASNATLLMAPQRLACSPTRPLAAHLDQTRPWTAQPDPGSPEAVIVSVPVLPIESGGLHHPDLHHGLKRIQTRVDSTHTAKVPLVKGSVPTPKLPNAPRRMADSMFSCDCTATITLPDGTVPPEFQPGADVLVNLPSRCRDFDFPALVWVRAYDITGIERFDQVIGSGQRLRSYTSSPFAFTLPSVAEMAAADMSDFDQVRITVEDDDDAWFLSTREAYCTEPFTIAVHPDAVADHDNKAWDIASSLQGSFLNGAVEVSCPTCVMDIDVATSFELDVEWHAGGWEVNAFRLQVDMALLVEVGLDLDIDLAALSRALEFDAKEFSRTWGPDITFFILGFPFTLSNDFGLTVDLSLSARGQSSPGDDSIQPAISGVLEAEWHGVVDWLERDADLLSVSGFPGTDNQFARFRHSVDQSLVDGRLPVVEAQISAPLTWEVRLGSPVSDLASIGLTFTSMAPYMKVTAQPGGNMEFCSPEDTFRAMVGIDTSVSVEADLELWWLNPRVSTVLHEAPNAPYRAACLPITGPPAVTPAPTPTPTPGQALIVCHDSGCSADCFHIHDSDLGVCHVFDDRNNNPIIPAPGSRLGDPDCIWLPTDAWTREDGFVFAKTHYGTMCSDSRSQTARVPVDGTCVRHAVGGTSLYLKVVPPPPVPPSRKPVTVCHDPGCSADCFVVQPIDLGLCHVFDDRNEYPIIPVDGSAPKDPECVWLPRNAFDRPGVVSVKTQDSRYFIGKTSMTHLS